MGKTMVLIDKSATRRRFLETLLALDHHTVVSFSKALDALGYVQLFSADLIVIDIALSQHGDMELYKSLQAEADAKRIPLMVLTALELAELKNLLLPELGAVMQVGALGHGLRQVVNILLHSPKIHPHIPENSQLLTAAQT